MDKPIVYIKHASIHHAVHSGYAKLLDYIPSDFISGEISAIPYRIRKTVASLLSDDAGIYDSSSVHKDWSLAKYMLRRRHGIAHYLNGERDIRFSTYLKKSRDWSFVASFHEPPDIIEREISDFRYIEQLDGAIAVGINQLTLLREKIKSDAITFIPHGVDTIFFNPSKEKWEQHSCLFVGQHLRDFETLEACANTIKKHFPNFKLRAVLRKDYTHLLPSLGNIEVFSGISDEQLRTLYQKSSVLILPLKEVTACNAILEALACGIPVVTTDLEGNRGYLDESCSFLMKKKDHKSMADAIIHLMENEDLNRQMRYKSRIRGEKFAWENIAEELLQYYEKWLS